MGEIRSAVLLGSNVTPLSPDLKGAHLLGPETQRISPNNPWPPLSAVTSL